MSMTLRQLAAAVNEFAPEALAYDWDNVGLQIGDPDATVTRVAVGLELNEALLRFAITNNCQAIITHHPLIFKPLRAVRSDSPAGRLQFELIRNNIGLVAAHTNLDRVMHGTNGALADLLGLRDWEILDPAIIAQSYKFTVFVPRDYTPKIIEAIHRGGGGRIGAYTHCTFRSPGTGTFIPQADARPFSGAHGRMEQADEDRLEAIVPDAALAGVLAEVRQAHPYEEVAFDVFPLHDADPAHGLGLVGNLPTKTPLRQFTQQARHAVGQEFVHFAGETRWPVKRVAIITGSAGSAAHMITPKVADVIVTGELNYHTALDITARGVGVVTLGHAASERIFAPYFCRKFAEQATVAASDVKFLPYDDFPEPWKPVRRADDSPRRGKDTK